MTVLKLDALLFSMDDIIPLLGWTQKHGDRFEVHMPAGVARAPLASIIYSPDILNATSDGVLINDHTRYREEELNRVLHTLKERNKKVFAVTNGVEPVDAINGSSERRAEELEIGYVGSPILRVLADCRPALSWLDHQGPTESLPAKYKEPIKCLERLGLVYRRNNKTFSLRRQRLKRVLEHESQNLTSDYNVEDLLSGNRYKKELWLCTG